MHTFVENVIIFVTTTPIDTKPSNVLQMVGTRVRAKFRRRKTRRLGPDSPQTKLTNSHIFIRLPCYCLPRLRYRAVLKHH